MRYLILIAFLLSATFATAQDSLNIRRIGQIRMARGYVYCLAVQGDFVYAGTGGDSTAEGLWVVDVQDPLHPDSTGYDTISTEWDALGISVADTLAVLASAAGQVDICGIGNPHAPQHLSNVGEGRGLVWDVAIQGNHVYTARYSPRGMSVENIADPLHPFTEGQVEMNDEPSAVCVAGSYAYIAAGDGVHVVDISTPSAPAEVAMVDDEGAMHSAVLGDYLYATNFGGAFSVIDISNPRAPVLQRMFETGGYTDGIAAADGHLFVAAGYGGLLVYDVSDPVRPVETGRWQSEDINPGMVVVQGRYAYVCADRYLQIFDCAAALGVENRNFILHPSSFILSCAPNPFNPGTVISFALPKAGTVRLSLYDINGRLVQTLANKPYAAGEHTTRLNGEGLSSGTYFVRLAADGQKQTQKVMLIR